jgi:hypothetical protein
MEIPCPVWPQGPWSPLGYQVVEVADENDPATETDQQLSRHSRQRETSQPPAQPWALPGYRVVEVEEEPSPRLARRPSPAPGAARRRPARKTRPLALWGGVAVGGALLLVTAIAAVPLRQASAERAGPPTVVPAEESGLPGGARCAARDSRRLDRETFGTTIGFVRNPAEAARIAAQEQKLTFLLHVSGSFEDAGFT